MYVVRYFWSHLCMRMTVDEGRRDSIGSLLKTYGYKKNVIPNKKTVYSGFLTHQMCTTCHLGCILTDDVKFNSLGLKINPQIFTFSVKRQRWMTSIKTEVFINTFFSGGRVWSVTAVKYNSKNYVKVRRPPKTTRLIGEATLVGFSPTH